MVDPKEACDWGLVNRVVATGTAFGQAFNMAKVKTFFINKMIVGQNEKKRFDYYKQAYLKCFILVVFARFSAFLTFRNY